jgi:hypothetical protein
VPWKIHQYYSDLKNIFNWHRTRENIFLQDFVLCIVYTCVCLCVCTAHLCSTKKLYFPSNIIEFNKTFIQTSTFFRLHAATIIIFHSDDNLLPQWFFLVLHRNLHHVDECLRVNHTSIFKEFHTCTTFFINNSNNNNIQKLIYHESIKVCWFTNIAFLCFEFS